VIFRVVAWKPPITTKNTKLGTARAVGIPADELIQKDGVSDED
jgi:hypothetical protein